MYTEAGVPCARGTVSSLRLFARHSLFFSSFQAKQSPQLLAAHDGLSMKSRDPPALCECSYIDRRSFKMCTCPCYIAMRTESSSYGADTKSGRARINWKCPGMAAVPRKCVEMQEMIHTYERRTLQLKCRCGKDAQSVLQSLMQEIPAGARGTVNACKYRSKRADERQSNTNDGDTSIRRAEIAALPRSPYWRLRRCWFSSKMHEKGAPRAQNEHRPRIDSQTAPYSMQILSKRV